MTRTLRNLLLLVLIGVSGSAFAQEIAGRVVDDKKVEIINAAVQVYQGGILKGGTLTDFDGNYVVKPLDPGSYDVLVLFMGYDTVKVTGVIVSAGNRTTQNFTLSKPKSKELTGVTVIAYKKPLVDVDKPGSLIRTKEEINQMPTTQITDIVSTGTNVYQAQRGGGVNLSGARGDGTQYIIDGVVVRGSTGIDMAQGSVEQLEVITSGIPANYGDVSGGVVNITSRGVSQKMTGSVRAQQSIDGYNNKLFSFSVAGPIYKKKVAGTDRKKPVLGFALSGDHYDDRDRYPTYNQEYVTNPAKLKELQQNPLHISSDNTGLPIYGYSSAYVTMKDLQKSKIPPHNRTQEERLVGKLDYQVTDNMHIVAGGSFDYTKQDAYSRARNLFAPEATPVVNTLTGRGYIRFTQKFGKSNDTSRHSIISNAYYKIQADYQKTYQDQHDPQFKENFFEYAYIGKFTQTRQDIFFPLQTDSASNRKGTMLVFSSPTRIDFERDKYNRNENLANYTAQFYNSLPFNSYPRFMTTIQSVALANGDEPKFTYDLFYSPGATQSAYTKFNSNQYALDVMASFDLQAGKTKHAIEFGLYYQQRIERSFTGLPNRAGEGTASIWQQMRLLVSSVDNGNLRYDKEHPIFRINGQNYNYVDNGTGAGHGYFTDQSGNIANVIPGATDTILYNYKNVGTSTFDKNLRKKLFGSSSDTRDINIDALDPSTFSLNMFSADELLNSGRSFVGYYGYTYTGEAQSGNVNFNDYWTKKDANGNYTRPIAPFSPNYIAGYIMDKFTYKDVHFNIGVRVDRYSSNQKVLVDPYSLYAEKTVSQVSGAQNVINGGQHPGNIGSSYVVYVDDNASSSPNIIGYRSGDNWYDPKGKFINDPSTLKQYSGGRDPQPAVVKDAAGKVPNIADSNFNPNTSFTDYTPQVTVQPRVSFSFPISDVANFYAHYDIYAQRPTSNTRANPSTYYFLEQNAQSTINNPNLKSQKTFDYEVGFQQKLSDHSALTITAFYKERKDMITVVPVLFAYPATYFTYGNRDFSTTKGTTFLYDLRATNHLRMTLAYTLQFSEGTGSSPSSHNGLLQSFIEAGLPNQRYVTALDYDSRHNITADLDYRYDEAQGPTIAGKHVFQRTGLHLIGKARSGEPYTRYTDALSTTVIGGVNGARRPWHYGIDLRLDKDFAINNLRKGKEVTEGVKPKRPLYLKAILTVNNLLNTRDVLGVYGYTGKSDDNGYLASPYGQQFVPQQTNPQSYVDLYRISINNPYNLNWARTISVALEFNF